MYTLRRLVCSDVVRLCIRDSLSYSTQIKYVARRRNRNLADPGISRRTKLVKDKEDATVDELEDIDLEGLESDFMNVHVSHKEAEMELEARKERERYLAIKQKYFKEKFPNFLTMTDKMQIKYLHRTDPEQWTIDRLSESFPALPHIIAKILKSNWNKKNVERIKSHDKAVCENWEKFKKGEFNDLPSDLKKHLKKFTNRQLNVDAYNPAFYEPDENKTIVYKSKNMKTEFSDIITSYEKLRTKQSEEEKPADELPLLGNSEENEQLSKKNRKRITLPLLKKQIETAVQGGKDVSETEMLILKEVKNMDPRNEIVELKEDVTAIQRHEEKTTKVSLLKKPKRDLSFLVYPHKITIPRKVYKRGCTYKLNDCYYDHQGFFLYRVPGMTS